MERRNFLKTFGALLGTTIGAAGTASARRDIGVRNFRDNAGVIDGIPDLDLVRTKNKYNPFKDTRYVYELAFDYEGHADGNYRLGVGNGGNNGRQFRLSADREGQESLTFHEKKWIDSVYTY